MWCNRNPYLQRPLLLRFCFHSQTGLKSRGDLETTILTQKPVDECLDAHSKRPLTVRYASVIKNKNIFLLKNVNVITEYQPESQYNVP